MGFPGAHWPTEGTHLPKHARHAPAKRRSRRGVIFLTSAVVLPAAIAAGIYGMGLRFFRGGPDPAAIALAGIPGSHSAAVLEQARQQMILVDAASQTLSLVSTPRLAARPSPGAAPASGTGSPVLVSMPPPSPGTAQAIAYRMLGSFGFSTSQFGCLDDIWSRESGWRYNAENASGAYGIPQALPGSKMASAGADWATNPATQIRWGLGYIKATYGTPCNAWAFWQAHGWY
jgi:hypothetical protein